MTLTEQAIATIAAGCEGVTEGPVKLLEWNDGPVDFQAQGVGFLGYVTTTDENGYRLGVFWYDHRAFETLAEAKAAAQADYARRIKSALVANSSLDPATVLALCALAQEALQSRREGQQMREATIEECARGAQDFVRYMWRGFEDENTLTGMYARSNRHASVELSVELATAIRALSRLSAPPAEAPIPPGIDPELVAYTRRLRQACALSGYHEHDGCSCSNSNLNEAYVSGRLKLPTRVGPDEPAPAEAKPVAWSYDLENVPRDRHFLIEYDHKEVTEGYYLDNSKTSVPWQGVRPANSMRRNRVSEKIVAWCEMPLPATDKVPAPTSSDDAPPTESILHPLADREKSAAIVHPDPRAKAAEAVPEGMVLVPREPTEAMRDAGFAAPYQAPMAVYRAMLAAAPQPDSTGEVK